MPWIASRTMLSESPRGTLRPAHTLLATHTMCRASSYQVNTHEARKISGSNDESSSSLPRHRSTSPSIHHSPDLADVASARAKTPSIDAPPEGGAQWLQVTRESAQGELSRYVNDQAPEHPYSMASSEEFASWSGFPDTLEPETFGTGDYQIHALGTRTGLPVSPRESSYVSQPGFPVYSHSTWPHIEAHPVEPG